MSEKIAYKIVQKDVEEIFLHQYTICVKEHLNQYSLSDTTIDSLANRHLQYFKDSFYDCEPKVIKKYISLGKLYHKLSIPIYDLISILNMTKRVLYTRLSQKDLLDKKFSHLDNIFYLIKQNISKGYLQEESHKFIKKYKEEMLESIHFRLHIKWMINLLTYIYKDASTKIPELNHNKKPFSQWLILPQPNLFFKNKNAREETIIFHNQIDTNAKSLITNFQRGHNYEAYGILEKIISLSTSMLYLLSQNIIFTTKNKEEQFFRYVHSEYKLNQTSHITILNIKKMGLINRYKGLDFGDKVLKEVKSAIKSFMVVLSDDIIFTKALNGEFYIYYPQMDIEDIIRIQNALKKHIETLIIDPNESEFFIKVSVGTISILNNFEYLDFEKLLHYTLKMAKESSEEIYYLPRDEEIKALEIIHTGEESLKNVQRALIHNHLELFYQPIVDLSTNHTSHLEVLARIKKDNIFIPAGAFIDLIYEMDIIVDLDIKILEKIRKDIKKIKCETDKLFINIAPKSFHSKDYINEFSKTISLLKANKITPYLELTEQSFMDNVETIKEIHSKYDVKFAVDDFGTGYSSLTTVALLAQNNIVEYIKIDGSITKNIITSQESYHILDSISYMSKKLKIKNVAEYIEDAEILKKVVKLNIEYGQGYYFSYPKSIDDFSNQSKKN